MNWVNVDTNRIESAKLETFSGQCLYKLRPLILVLLVALWAPGCGEDPRTMEQADAGADAGTIAPVLLQLQVPHSVAAGTEHSCVIAGDGLVSCWGPNSVGQLGDGTNHPRSLPTPVRGIGKAVAIAAGGHHTCALIEDGTVACWGEGTDGQLGDGAGQNSYDPVTVSGISNAVGISLGSS